MSLAQSVQCSCASRPHIWVILNDYMLPWTIHYFRIFFHFRTPKLSSFPTLKLNVSWFWQSFTQCLNIFEQLILTQFLSCLFEIGWNNSKTQISAFHTWGDMAKNIKMFAAEIDRPISIEQINWPNLSY